MLTNPFDGHNFENFFAHSTFCSNRTVRTIISPLPNLVQEKGGTWISSLKWILPHTWKTKAESFNKAAKNDNAPVNFGLWNHRILPLFPSLTEKSLDQFRSFFLMVQSGNFT